MIIFLEMLCELIKKDVNKIKELDVSMLVSPNLQKSEEVAFLKGKIKMADLILESIRVNHNNIVIDNNLKK